MVKRFFYSCFISILLISFSTNAQQMGRMGKTKLPPLRHNPNREFHMVHLALNFHFNIKKKEVFGTATEKIVPLQENYNTVHLNAVDMKIDKVTLGDKALKYQYDGKILTIDLDKAYGLNDTLTYSVEYSTIPSKGIFFVLPDKGYPDRTPQLWSQSESEDAQYWYPCHDYPDDFSTSELTATVPADWVVVANGVLKNVATNKKDKTKTYHWVESKPHVVYLNSIVAGKFKIVKDHYGKIPLYYYVEPKYAKDAMLDFHQLPDILKFYSSVTGYQYPWEKLSLSTVTDFTEGGMENVSAITLTDQTLHGKNAEPNVTSTSLVAHETAHQWFGDLLTCRGWMNSWLNEGFADYFDALYEKHAYGDQYFEYFMHGYHENVIRADKRQRHATYYARYNSPDDVFSTYIYPRGASILNMIRGVLGDKLFFKAIKYYVHKFQFQNVDTHNFLNAISEATGQNLYWLFDEWVYKGGHPVFDVDYNYDSGTHMLTLNVEQTQKVDSLTPVYKMPVNIYIVTPSQKINKVVWVDSLKNSFTFSVPDKPLMVNFDEGHYLLKEMKFKKSLDELAYQLKSDPDATGRMWAADQLGKMKGHEPVVALSSSLRDDNFWGVRSECAKNLANFETKDAREALTAALQDKDDRVQMSAINSLAKFKNGDVANLLKHKLNESKNYSVRASAITSLAAVDSINAMPEIQKALKTDSYQQIIKSAALTALIKVDSVKGYQAAVKFSKYGVPNGLRLRALFSFGRNDVNKPETASLLKEYAHDPYIWARMITYMDLGKVGNESVIPLLKERVKAETNNRLIKTAERAIKQIESRNKKS